MGNAAGTIGFAIGQYAKQRQEKAKKANALRKAMAVYDPENKDRYTAMGFDDLEAEYHAQALKRAEEARKLDMSYKQSQLDSAQQGRMLSQAQIANLQADNERANEALKLSKQQASDAKWSGIRRDAQTWWDRTMQAKRLSDHDAALAKPPTVVDLDGNPYAFQAGTGHMQPLLNRNELTAPQRAKTASDLTGRISQLSKQLDSLDPREPDYKALHQVLRDNLSLTQKARDQLLDLSQSDPFAAPKQDGHSKPIEFESKLQTKTPATGNKIMKALKPMTDDEAIHFMALARGDRKKAIELAEQAGFKF